MMPSKKVYLSYVKKDGVLANKLSEYLEKHGVSVWEDSNVLPGDKWDQAIEQALKDSDFIITLLTPHAFKSNWIRKEFEIAFFDEKFKDRVFTVLIGGKNEDFDSLPWIYSKLKSLRVDSSKSLKNQVEIIGKAFSKQMKEAGNAP